MLHDTKEQLTASNYTVFKVLARRAPASEARIPEEYLNTSDALPTTAEVQP